MRAVRSGYKIVNGYLFEYPCAQHAIHRLCQFDGGHLTFDMPVMCKLRIYNGGE